jgi:NADPH-dependent 2,4-dienoyl-CoA reductase/sulfur reductase-like enzyme
MGRILIIGGSDAGISAALRARELDSTAEVTIVLADDYPNFSICGLPYFISGETPDWRALAHRTEFPGIEVLRGHTASSIEPRAKSVAVRVAATNTEKSLPYDRLVVATGATPIRPELPGAMLDGVFLFHTMADSFAPQQYLTDRAPKAAVIVGAGYIGLEMADALTKRGIRVTLLSRTETVLGAGLRGCWPRGRSGPACGGGAPGERSCLRSGCPARREWRSRRRGRSGAFPRRRGRRSE